MEPMAYMMAVEPLAMREHTQHRTPHACTT